LEKYIPKLLLILFPFYPLWGAVFYTVSHQNIENFINLLWLPIVIYYLITKNNRFPKYLIFLILFTLFHVSSAYFNNIIVSDSDLLFYILFDPNVVACLLLFIIENTSFDERFITIMNRNIMIIVVISLIVSIIQIADPSFFISPNLNDSEGISSFVEESRNFSIYSWININSVGITFPILISILLNVSDIKHKSFPLILISGIIVSFLTKARYVMISTIIVFSQLFLTAKISLLNKIISASLVVISIIFLLAVAENTGFNIQQVIDERIMEKGNDMESAKARVTSYYVFLIKFPENPWFGVGPATRDDVVQLLGGEAPLIHVGYLSYLYFYGVFGFFLMIVSIFYLLKMAYKVGRKYLFWGSFYGLITFCFANTTCVYFNFSEMGIILAVLYLKYFNDQDVNEMPDLVA
jgi:hypothetical protein